LFYDCCLFPFVVLHTRFVAHIYVVPHYVPLLILRLFVIVSFAFHLWFDTFVCVVDLLLFSRCCCHYVTFHICYCFVINLLFRVCYLVVVVLFHVVVDHCPFVVVVDLLLHLLLFC